jgi:hypothetical protein
MAVAVKSCWRCVHANPRYRLRRRSTRLVPGERRRLPPARRAYRALHSGVSWRCRAIWMASWWACGWTVSWRGAARAEGHARRAGQARQVARSTRRRMTGAPETSCPGRLAIGGPCHILPHDDQRQAPGGDFHGAALRGLEIRTALRSHLVPSVGVPSGGLAQDFLRQKYGLLHSAGKRPGAL